MNCFYITTELLQQGNIGSYRYKIINATEMAKPFKGKLAADFLRLKTTKDFILALEARYGNSHNGGDREVLRIVQGGTPELQGTWMD